MTHEEKKGRGCLFYGCLTLFIIGLLIIGVIVYGAWKVREYAIAQTDPQPLEFNEVDTSPEAITSIKEKIELFLIAVKEGKSTATLALTAEEINSLIYSDEEFRQTGIGVEVDFKDDKATGRLSLPIGDFVPGGFLKGRYLNGMASLNISGKDGLIVVTVDSFEVKGKPLPELFMRELRKHNFAEGMYEDPETVAVMRRIKQLELKEGKLFMQVTPGPEDSE